MKKFLARVRRHPDRRPTAHGEIAAPLPNKEPTIYDSIDGACEWLYKSA